MFLWRFKNFKNQFTQFRFRTFLHNCYFIFLFRQKLLRKLFELLKLFTHFKNESSLNVVEISKNFDFLATCRSLRYSIFCVFCLLSSLRIVIFVNNSLSSLSNSIQPFIQSLPKPTPSSFKNIISF